MEVKKVLSFTNPPVTEVILEVQFLSSPFPLAAFGHLQLALNSRYPDVVAVPAGPPLNMPNLSQDNPIQIQFPVSFDAGENVRIRFSNKEDPYVVQLQSNMLILNWVSRDGKFSYPGFKKLSEKMDSLYEEISSIVASVSGTPLSPDFCGVVYDNQIVCSDSEADFSDVRQVCPAWRNLSEIGGGTDFENMTTHARFSLRDNEEKVGALAVLVSEVGANPPLHGKRSRIKLTARGLPRGDAYGGVAAFYDLAHMKIITTFDAMTSKEAQQKWGKQNV